MHHISMEVAEMLSALRSTLEDPSGAATTSGAPQEPSAPVFISSLDTDPSLRHGTHYVLFMLFMQ